MKGRGVFYGSVLHSSEYKNGMEYKGKKVLVVGCGNSEMEMCLDLREHSAIPFIYVRNGVHALPREIPGTSTFKLAMKLMKWLPVRMVDKVLVMVAKFVIGDTEKYGSKRPRMGPLELKNMTGKTEPLRYYYYFYLIIYILQKVKGKISFHLQSCTSSQWIGRYGRAWS
ncbi:putative indole-3-pyruvate monooxygenase [Dioscorea sansibarensis]